MFNNTYAFSGHFISPIINLLRTVYDPRFRCRMVYHNRRLVKRLIALTEIVSILDQIDYIEDGEVGNWWRNGHIVYMKGSAEPKFDKEETVYVYGKD